jgi:DnaJ-domain-containing protein 1
MAEVTNPLRDRVFPRRKSVNQAEAAETRTQLVKQLVSAESAALDAKTVKLRALRLAKEEAERAEALANPPVKATKKRSGA